MPNSELDATKLAVEAAENESAEAALLMGNTRGSAEDKVQWGINMGVSAHVTALQQVVDVLGEASALLTDAHATAGRVKSMLAQVSEQSSREDLIKQVSAAGEKLGQVSTTVSGAKAKIDNEAVKHAQLSGDEDLMKAVNATATKTTEASAQAENAKTVTESYQQKLQAAPGN